VLKGSERRAADYPVDPLFVDRWSPRAMAGEPISADELFVLFEAARWAPSSGNLQPWRMLYAHRDTPEWPTFFGLLKESNQTWCRNAAVLVVVASQQTNSRTGAALKTHSYDTGAAWQNIALQGSRSGLVVHGMAGFDYDLARERLQIPETWRVEAMIAIGRPGPVEGLSESLQARETPSQRHPVTSFVFEGVWSDRGVKPSSEFPITAPRDSSR
jgi:nitroreductase